MIEHFLFFFFNDTATTEIYTLSLHDALPISGILEGRHVRQDELIAYVEENLRLAADALRQTSDDYDATDEAADRKSTRLNSSHANISYAVFCLKKKKIKI